MTSNGPCTAAGTPYPCCTGNKTGTCNKTYVHLKSSISPTVFVSGYQDWQFGPADANGLRQVVIPAIGTHFNCVEALGLATACVRSGSDGTGIVDCNGTAGTPNYNSTVQQDHNTNAGVDPGFPPDPDCTATFTEPPPLSLVSSATLETGYCVGGPTPGAACGSDTNCGNGGTCTRICSGGPTPGAACTSDGNCGTDGKCTGDFHPTACNSPIHIVESGTFAAGGMKLSENLILRLSTSVTKCDPNPCPPDGTPYQDSANCTGAGTPYSCCTGVHDGDCDNIQVSASVTTGMTTVTIYDANNVIVGPGTPTPTPLMDKLTGLPFGCANIDAGVLNTGKIGAGATVLDIQPPTLTDGVATIAIICQ